MNAARAADWCDYLASHARRVYAEVLHSEDIAARSLAVKITEGSLGQEFTPRDVYRRHWRGLGKDSVMSALEVLQDFGWVRITQVKSSGRPKTLVTVNPGIFSHHDN